MSGLKVPATSMNRLMYPIITGSINPSAGDTMQCFIGAVEMDENIIHIFYTGNSADGDIDTIFKTEKTIDGNIQAGYEKILEGGIPKLIIGPTNQNGDFDEDEVFMRSIVRESDHHKIYYAGKDDNGNPLVAIGIATTTDLENVTRVGQVYADSENESVISLYITKNNEGDYRAFAQRQVLGTSDFEVDYLTSSDGEIFTEVTRGITIDSIIKVTQLTKIGNKFYVMGDGEHTDPHAPVNNVIYCYSTVDFVSYNLVFSFRKQEPAERGIGGGNLIKLNEKILIFHNYTKNINKSATSNGEPFSAVKVIDTGVSTPEQINDLQINIVYPNFVKKYWPLYEENESTAFIERIDGDEVTVNSPSWSSDGLSFYNFPGTGITFPNNNSIQNLSDLALKARVEIITSGTINVFEIGTDIQVSLVSGKLRVRLNNGTKDYISTSNIANPTGITYIDNHCYIGFIFKSGVLKLCFGDTIDVSVDKTIDGAMTNINDSGDNVVIGNGATIEARSFVLMSGQTDNEWITCDL